ncbi:hypothetical protein ACFTQ7_08520 [Lysinibacillus sp. NPDC056959]|uniref:hypothetical protein n=1 Tax=Lysinibacillus sp. NPDC056959 TaxID=3345981 RepID=UPI003633FF3A
MKQVLNQNGIYIQRSEDGKSRYIGSAYGSGGIISRWMTHLEFLGNANDDKMQFTNKTTKAAVRDFIKQAVDKGLIEKLWLDKFDNGTMTNGDYEGLKLIIAQRSN